ncbi:MAG: hypothetical protein EHM48_01995 [Planctomycetaceae bacterium]|nr:MAG: hypothetical protein EHM48_01995 [Planctomycetaceae bacterium]
MALMQESIADGCDVRMVQSRSDMRHFKQLPRRLYAHDPHAVLPLSSFQNFVLDRKHHPFYDGGRGAVAEFFLAFDSATGKPVGRIAAIIDHRHNQLAMQRDPHHELCGHFGFFDCVNSPLVAQKLIDAAAAWLRSQGIKRMLGPASPSQSYDYGLLIEGHHCPHRFLLPYHPAYYAGLLEGCGLSKARDLLSLSGDLQDPRCRKPLERLTERTGTMRTRLAENITIRPIDMRRYRQETDILGEVLNEALMDHFGHSPITGREWRLITDSLKPVVDPKFVLIAEREGSPVGLAIALPDINELIGKLRLRFGFIETLELLVRSWRWRPQCVTIVVMGSTREGNNFAVTPLLIGQLTRNLLDNDVRFVDAHQILEDNDGMLAPVLRHGLVVDRRYRVYQMAL